MCKKVFQVVNGSSFSIIGDSLFFEGNLMGEKNPDYKVYLTNSKGEVIVRNLQKVEWSKSPGDAYRLCRLHFIVTDGWSVEADLLENIFGDTSLNVKNESKWNTFHNLFRIIGIGEVVHSISIDDVFERVVVELQVV